MTDNLLADIINPSLPAPLARAPQGDTFAKLLASVWGALIIIAGLFFLIYLIIGGLQWITAGGDKMHLESARGKITNALIGLVIVLASFVIITIVEAVFGISILNPIFPTPIP